MRKEIQIVLGLLFISINCVLAQVPHGSISISIEESQIGVYDIFPDFGMVEYIADRDVYAFEQNLSNNLVQRDTLIDPTDSIQKRTIVHRDGWVNFNYHKNRLYSSLIKHDMDSMLVYFYTGSGDSETDRLLENNYITIENIKLKNIVFHKGTALINIFDERLKTLRRAYPDDQLPIDDTLVIEGNLICLNIISDQVLTPTKFKDVLENKNINSLSEEYKLLTNVLEKAGQ